jgi:hypothetical protein
MTRRRSPGAHRPELGFIVIPRNGTGEVFCQRVYRTTRETSSRMILARPRFITTFRVRTNPPSEETRGNKWFDPGLFGLHLQPQ